MNYRLTLQYDGTDFHGWQTQANGQRTIQGELTRALSLLDNREVIVHGAGRTDAGVHAVGQVANVNLRRAFTPERLRVALNANLPFDVRARSVEIMSDDFHARVSARGKTYRYLIYNAACASPFYWRYALHESRALDLEAMQCAAQHFIGAHDFTAFSSAQTKVKSRVRTITQLDLSETPPTNYFAFGCVENPTCDETRLLVITISANGFLRYMVRIVAAALLAVGRGETNGEAIQHALETGQRNALFATAAAKGLTLLEVNY